jgi:hypothetical protein
MSFKVSRNLPGNGGFIYHLENSWVYPSPDKRDIDVSPVRVVYLKHLVPLMHEFEINITS